MAKDLRGLVNYLPWAAQEELDRELEIYRESVTDAILHLRHEANRFEDFLEEVLYGYPRPERDRDR